MMSAEPSRLLTRRRPSLWTTSNYKTLRGEQRGYRTAILHLAPAHTAFMDGRSVCPYSTPQCEALCLNTAGRGVFDGVQAARIRRTRWLFEDRAGFLSALCEDLQREQRRARRLGLQLVVRPNGTSDLPFLAHHLASWFSDVQFYDYTKVPKPWERTRHAPNYALTFSRSESNEVACADALRNGVNVAVVFSTRKGQPLPATWQGVKVVDGDIDDLRFLDEKGGVVVGLRAKGKARRPEVQGGFVVQV